MGNLIILLLRDTCIVSFMKNTAKNFMNMFPGALESSWIFVSSLFWLDEKRQGSAEYTGTGAKRGMIEKMTFLTQFVPDKI